MEITKHGVLKRWEFQLKGAGTTPFCRGADGRAVLRSSVREFLVSEAMFNLGVPTTRALSLVVSDSELVRRPWYSSHAGWKKDPDTMVKDRAAITCRVSPSFLRVGHLQLYERRIKRSQDEQERAMRIKELEAMVEHCIFREFPEINNRHSVTKPDPSTFLIRIWSNTHSSLGTLQQRVLEMLSTVSQRISMLTAHWLRVGFCQGNFNSDNCLVAGRTMDYGPFGFIEKFTPLWCMWTGGGQHFGFMNQPEAGARNFGSLFKAVLPLLDSDNEATARGILRSHEIISSSIANDMWRQKLGLIEWCKAADDLLKDLITLMEDTVVDYTIFWRQLACVVERLMNKEIDVVSDEDLVALLRDMFYEAPRPRNYIALWAKWLREWFVLLHLTIQTPLEVATAMRKVSPMYVPREWMLVEAYTAAHKGNYSVIHELEDLFLAPYDEQTPEKRERYYKKAPDVVYQGIGLGGTAFMT